MPITKSDGKKDGLQKYRVRINYTDSFGNHKQIERTAYGMTAAKELEYKLTQETKGGSQKRMTLEELTAEYMQINSGEIRQTTLRTKQGTLEHYILPYLGRARIDKINAKTLHDWKQSLNEYNGKYGALSLSTKQRSYTILKSILNFAVKMEYIEKNPMILVGQFKDAYQGKKKMDYYTAEEFHKFIAAAKSEAEQEEEQGYISEWRYYIFFLLAFYGGFRKGELNALQWTDIEGNMCHITKSVTQKVKGEDAVITPPKNKNSIRDIQLPPKVMAELKTYYNKVSALDGFTEDWYICGTDTPLKDTGIENRNKKYANSAQLKKIRIHDFRHSHASLLANSGINIQEVARRLGHSDVSMTWNTYSHLYPKEEERALKVLEQA